MRRNAVRRRHRESGFSLLEMVTVAAIGIIITVISVVSMMPVLNGQHVINAYNTTLSALRQARDNAVSQSTSYMVTFSTTTTPNTITVAPTLTFTGDQRSVTYSLPTDVMFQVNSAITGATPPDGGSAGQSFGAGTNAIDFGYTANGSTGLETIYFCPDGSAQTLTSGSSICAGVNNWDDGVVYMARNGDLLSSRAVNLWGGTGRIRGWRLYAKSGGGYVWVRQ